MQEAENYNAFLRGLIRTFALDTSAVLDFGAGIGDFSGSLDIPPSQVTCIEPDTHAQTYLASQGFETHGNLENIAGDRFTYIFSLNVLEHIEDDNKIVAELYRVIRPGGRIFVYVPAFQVLFSAMDSNVGHYRRYNMRSLTQVMLSAGFTVEKHAYTDALGFFAALVYKIIYRQSDGILNKSSVRFYDRFLFPVSRILSPLLSKVLGKNLYVIAYKPVNTI
jgi:SAM-dependent methyltransferase